tara:strand:- start:802 stop:2064 length:1263 start_codon:yes stop_codon:yes gene_type:complete
MPKSKIDNKKRVKQSGGATSKKPSFKRFLAIFGLNAASKVITPFQAIFKLLDRLEVFEKKLQLIIKITSYIINAFGLIIVIYIIILLLIAAIIGFFINVLNQPDTANKLATVMENMMMLGGESAAADVLYIFIALFKCILAMLLIIIFSITGNKILDSLQASSPLASLVSTIGDNLCYLLAILGILFSIGLFLGFYNLTCIKDLGVKTYSGNVGDFITLLIGIIAIILSLLGFILKQLYHTPYLIKKYLNRVPTGQQEKRMINFKKTMMFFGVFIFLYLFIKICNHISGTVGDATTKFLLLINMKPSDSSDSTDYGEKCSFENKLNTGESNIVKTIKGMLTTIFIFFIMIVVVLTGPLDAILTKIFGPLIKISCELNTKAMVNVRPLIVGGPDPVVGRPVVTGHPLGIGRGTGATASSPQ